MKTSDDRIRQLVDGFREARARQTNNERLKSHTLKQLLVDFRAAAERQRERDRFNPRINLLEVLGRGADERIHCRLLQWLLDPKGTHAQGPAFLDELLQWIELSTMNSESAKVGCEARGDDSRIDIEVLIAGRVLLHIEAKIDAGEGEDQTVREARDLRQRASDHGIRTENAKGIFLTRSGESPADGAFKPMPWQSLAHCLRKVEVGPPGARTLIDHVLSCLESLSGGTAMNDQSEIQKYILNHRADVSDLLDACDEFDKLISSEFSLEAIEAALTDSAFPGQWTAGRESKGRDLLARHPEFFRGPGDSWTCFEAAPISLRSLLANGDERPCVGLWWEPIRKRLTDDEASEAKRLLLSIIETKGLPGGRRMGPPEKNLPVWWYVDFGLSDSTRLSDLPRLLAQEWKLLLPLVPKVIELSNLVGRREKP